MTGPHRVNRSGGRNGRLSGIRLGSPVANAKEEEPPGHPLPPPLQIRPFKPFAPTDLGGENRDRNPTGSTGPASRR